MKAKKKPLWLGQVLCTPFIAFWILLPYGITAANAQTPQQIAKKAFGATVLLVMEDANRQAISIGSGFYVNHGEIATNFHVIEGATGGYAKRIGEKTKWEIKGVTAIDVKRDLVILEVNPFSLISLEGKSGEPLSLGDSNVAMVGEPVYAVGNPRGLEGTFSQGIISGIREIGTDKLLQLTAPISPGSSGGPVLNSKGKVIGVSVATFRGGQNLNFAIPSNYLKALVAQVGPAKPLSQMKSAKSGHSILADVGDPSMEGVTGGKFTWSGSSSRMPNYSFSLRNRLRQNVKNVYCLVIFYDMQGDPIDVDVVEYPGLIHAGLAKRITDWVSDRSVKELSTEWNKEKRILETRVEFRVLDFEIVE